MAKSILASLGAVGVIKGLPVRTWKGFHASRVGHSTRRMQYKNTTARPQIGMNAIKAAVNELGGRVEILVPLKN